MNTDLFTANTETATGLFFDELRENNNSYEGNILWDTVCGATNHSDFLSFARNFLMEDSSDGDRAIRVINKGNELFPENKELKKILEKLASLTRRVSPENESYSLRLANFVKKFF